MKGAVRKLLSCAPLTTAAEHSWPKLLSYSDVRWKRSLQLAHGGLKIGHIRTTQLISAWLTKDTNAACSLVLAPLSTTEVFLPWEALIQTPAVLMSPSRNLGKLELCFFHSVQSSDKADGPSAYAHVSQRVSKGWHSARRQRQGKALVAE